MSRIANGAALRRNDRITGNRSNIWRHVILVAAIIGPFFVAGSTSIPVDGDLDPAFGTGGVVMTDFNTSTDLANAVALQPDGKLVVAGTTYVNNDFSDEDFAIARYNPDGSLDASFGNNGKVTTDFPGLAAVISAVVVQPDGKIVVAGGAYPLFTFAGDFKVARYNPNGSLDTSFGAGGIVTTIFPGDGSFAFALALQSDGKIIAAGTDFFDFNPGDMSDTNFALARYNSDGSLDTTFGNGGTITTDFLGAEDDVFSVLIQPDGKIVAVGSANSPFDYYDFAAARYLANGTLDTTFGTGGKVRTDFGNNDLDIAYAAVLQPDGKIVSAGTTVFDFGVQQQFALTRSNSDGTLDTTFGTGGRVLIDFGSFAQSANAVLIQPDGKIITVGYPNTESKDSDFLLARCNPNGSLDPSFGVGGKVRTSFGDLGAAANGAVLQPDHKIVAVGWNATENASGVEFALARYLGTPGGTPTPTPTATPTVTPTPSPTATPTPPPTPTPTPTATPTPTPTATPTSTATATPTPTPTATSTPSPTSTPAPTATPTPTPPNASPYDFNHDGRPDFVLYNRSTRQTAIWYMHNNVLAGGAFGPVLPAGWSLIGVADFNRDGNNDYALFNSSARQTAIWYLSRNMIIGSAWGPTVPSGWALVATGDFNGDSKPDFVIYKPSTGQTGVWYLNNNVYIGGTFGPTLPAGWILAGLADFNGNGQTDYALFNPATHQSGIYYLSGTVYVGSAFGPTIASGYELMGTADFNANGRPDYLLYNASTRRTALYYLNNNVYVGSALGPVLPAGWNLVAP
jgi:uncharacterized delta-60 repeat protein